MKICLISILLLMISNRLLAGDDIYRELGISISKKQPNLKLTTKKREICKECKMKKIYKTTLSKLAKHIKSQKVSKDKTHYGLGVDYKVSKKVQLSIDILAELNVNKPSNMMKDNQANIKLAISL